MSRFLAALLASSSLTMAATAALAQSETIGNLTAASSVTGPDRTVVEQGGGSCPGTPPGCTDRQATAAQLEAYMAATITAATNSWSAVQTFPAPGASLGSIVLTPGTISGTPPNGSLWVTGSGAFAEVAGAAVNLGQALPGGASGQLQYNNGPFAGASALTYSGTTLTDTGSLNLNTDAALFELTSTAGSHWLQAAMGGGFGNFDLTFGSEFAIAGVGLSADGASGAVLDLGNGTPLDTSGTLKLATLKAATAINLPSPNAGLVTPQITGSVVKLYQPIDITLFAGNGFAIPGGSDGRIAYGGVATGGNGTLGLSLIGIAPTLYCDEFSPYCTVRQLDAFSTTNGMQSFGLEAGPNNSQNLEIGLSRFTGTITQISQLETLDWIIGPGGVQHYNITAGGSGYSSAPTATLTPVGCSQAPSTPVALISGGAVYGLSGVSPGLGCSSVTVSISGGGGSGATAATTLTTNPDAFPAGPQFMWHSVSLNGFANYLGMGQADLGANRLLIGEADNQAKPWETTPSLQPTLVIPGAVEFDTANGAGHLGFTAGERLHDVAGVLSLETPSGSAQAPLALSFERVAPTTVSGLSSRDPSPTDGDSAYVTDAVACSTLNAAVTGSGSAHCRVHYDGSSWKVG